MIAIGLFIVSITTAHLKFYLAKGIMKINELEVAKGQLPFCIPMAEEQVGKNIFPK